MEQVGTVTIEDSIVTLIHSFGGSDVTVQNAMQGYQQIVVVWTDSDGDTCGFQANDLTVIERYILNHHNYEHLRL